VRRDANQFFKPQHDENDKKPSQKAQYPDRLRQKKR